MTLFQHKSEEPMLCALKQAEEAFKADEVPVGAVLVQGGKILSESHNLAKTLSDPTAHAELLAIRSAAEALDTAHLDDCDLYVTLEPCAMCAGAIALARIRTVYFGAYDPKGGGVEHGARVFQHTLHKPQVVGGVQESDCSKLLIDFFKGKR